MTLDDLRNEDRIALENLDCFRLRHEHFSYETDKGVTKGVYTLLRIYENYGEHVATLSGCDAAPLCTAVRATVLYRGEKLPATIRKRQDGDVDLLFTPNFTE